MPVATIAVDGLGRIGRAFVKLVVTRPELELVAVNDLVDPDDLVHLMRVDSAAARVLHPAA